MALYVRYRFIDSIVNTEQVRPFPLAILQHVDYYGYIYKNACISL